MVTKRSISRLTHASQRSQMIHSGMFRMYVHLSGKRHRNVNNNVLCNFRAFDMVFSVPDGRTKGYPTIYLLYGWLIDSFDGFADVRTNTAVCSDAVRCVVGIIATAPCCACACAAIVKQSERAWWRTDATIFRVLLEDLSRSQT